MDSKNFSIKTLCNALAGKKEFSGSMEEALRQLRFEVPPSAWKNLAAIYGHVNFENLHPHFFPDLLLGLAFSYDPDRGLNNFERFTEKIYDKNYLYTLLATQKNLLANLVSLFSGSQYLTDLLLKEPETFNWLQLPDTLRQSKLKDQLYRESWEWISKCKNEAERYSAVRKFKKREYLRIGLRDLTRLAPLEEILGEISNLADVLLQQCYEFSLAEMVEKHGHPFHLERSGEEKPSEFAVMGMGKLGGTELNYSSDIDLLYVYTSEKGATKPDKSTQRGISNHEFFSKLARKVTSAMNKLTADGSVFRVDLGLRPEGSSGDIASSLRSYEVYYESWGRTWERMALLKARTCAGSRALGEAFKDMCRPFVYRKYLDLRAIDEAKEMKEKINQEALSKSHGIKNVKLGLGGIREIEFVAQVFNLLYGGKDQQIRGNNLLTSLDKLAAYEYISEIERENLRKAYIFLRELEHRIQISYGLQTQEFSQDPKEEEILALKMGLRGESRVELCAELEKNYAHHTGEVRKIYNRLFYEGELKDNQKRREESAPGEKFEKHEISEETIASFPFTNKKKIVKNLLLMRDGEPFSHPTERSVAQFNAVLPKLLELAAKQPDPDQAVNNLEKFVRRCNGRNSLYEMLGRSGEALSLLLVLFGGSDLFSNTLISQPYLLDSLFAPEWLHKFKPRETLDREIGEILSGITDHRLIINKLRTFKKGEEFRIGLRYLIKETSYEDMVEDLSTLAELYLSQVLQISLDSPAAAGVSQEICGFSIIGMGKLGGREIDYGSDLDIIFIFDEGKVPSSGNLGSLSPHEYYSSIAESIYKLTSRPTRVGVAYTIDAGLRPEGEMGSLAVSLQGFSEYLNKRAVVWERQSLIKARLVAGDKEVGGKFLKIAGRFVYGEPLSLSAIADIRRLRKKVVEENARKDKNAVNIKLGPGGLMDIEFIAQLLQLKHGYLAARLRVPSTLEALSQIQHLGLMDPMECEFLSGSYRFLRRAITALRINKDGPANTLPEDPAQARKLVLCLGYGQGGEKGNTHTDTEILTEEFQRECRERMEKVRRVYGRVFTVKTGGAGMSKG